jgi:hypothetical protein
LSFESYILAPVFGNGWDPEGSGLVAGMRDLQRQRLKLKWQQNDDTELRSRLRSLRQLEVFGFLCFRARPKSTVPWSRLPYSLSMNASPVLSLYRYFVAASRMQHHFEANPVPFEEPQSAKPEDRNRVLELFAGPRGNFMYYWYGSLYAVVEGFQKLQLNDQTIDALLGSPNVNALRRCRNGAFHFRPTYFSARSLKAISTDEFVRWVREVMTAFRSYFDRQPRMDAKERE